MKFIIATILMIPTIAFAKPKPSPTPVPVEQTESTDQLIEDAEQEIGLLQSQLDGALTNATETKHQLDATNTNLADAAKKTEALQTQIDGQTTVLNQKVDEVNSLTTQVEVWKAKQAEALKKLNFWRAIAATIGGLISLYGVFLVLKVMGKIP